MRRIVCLLTAMVLTTALVGCSGEKDRGQNRDLDKPKAGEKEK